MRRRGRQRRPRPASLDGRRRALAGHVGRRDADRRGRAAKAPRPPSRPRPTSRPEPSAEPAETRAMTATRPPSRADGPRRRMRTPLVRPDHDGEPTTSTAETPTTPAETAEPPRPRSRLGPPTAAGDDAEPGDDSARRGDDSGPASATTRSRDRRRGHGAARDVIIAAGHHGRDRPPPLRGPVMPMDVVADPGFHRPGRATPTDGRARRRSPVLGVIGDAFRRPRRARIARGRPGLLPGPRRSQPRPRTPRRRPS